MTHDADYDPKAMDMRNPTNWPDELLERMTPVRQDPAKKVLFERIAQAMDTGEIQQKKYWFHVPQGKTAANLAAQMERVDRAMSAMQAFTAYTVGGVDLASTPDFSAYGGRISSNG